MGGLKIGWGGKNFRWGGTVMCNIWGTPTHPSVLRYDMILDMLGAYSLSFLPLSLLFLPSFLLLFSFFLALLNLCLFKESFFPLTSIPSLVYSPCVLRRIGLFLSSISLSLSLGLCLFLSLSLSLPPLSLSG